MKAKNIVTSSSHSKDSHPWRTKTFWMQAHPPSASQVKEILPTIKTNRRVYITRMAYRSYTAILKNNNNKHQYIVSKEFQLLKKSYSSSYHFSKRGQCKNLSNSLENGLLLPPCPRTLYKCCRVPLKILKILPSIASSGCHFFPKSFSCSFPPCLSFQANLPDLFF